MKNEITNALVKGLMGYRITKKEQAELEAWKANDPANQNLYEAFQDRQMLKEHLRHGKVIKHTKWLTMKRAFKRPHFDGKHVPWPHKQDRQWLLGKLSDQATYGYMPKALPRGKYNIDELDRCIFMTIAEMVEYRINLKIAGHDVTTMDLVIDVLSAAYKDEFLPAMPTKEGIALFNELMKLA